MNKTIAQLGVVLFGLLLIATPVLAYQSPGKPTGLVNDFAGLLAADQRASLENKLQTFETQTGTEIAVVTVSDLGPETIETYATTLFQEWGIGKEDKDNGVLLIVAPLDRETRIEVGYGLEPVITDIKSNEIIRQILVPAFQKNDYAGGIDQATTELMSLAQGEFGELDYAAAEAAARPINWETIIFGAFFGFIYLGSILGRSKSWWAGGLVGAVGAIAMSIWLGLLWWGLISFVVLIPLGILFDFIVSRRYQQGVKTGDFPWWIGGPGTGSSGFGGSGFGGFGGGMSGGGGASGRW